MTGRMDTADWIVFAYCALLVIGIVALNVRDKRRDAAARRMFTGNRKGNVK